MPKRRLAELRAPLAASAAALSMRLGYGTADGDPPVAASPTPRQDAGKASGPGR
jgi:hypothetical protein